MPNIETLTLAKALSVKNRLAGRLTQARSNIETYNSVLADQRDDYGKATVDVRVIVYGSTLKCSRFMVGRSCALPL